MKDFPNWWIFLWLKNLSRKKLQRKILRTFFPLWLYQHINIKSLRVFRSRHSCSKLKKIMENAIILWHNTKGWKIFHQRISFPRFPPHGNLSTKANCGFTLSFIVYFNSQSLLGIWKLFNENFLKVLTAVGCNTCKWYVAFSLSGQHSIR